MKVFSSSQSTYVRRYVYKSRVFVWRVSVEWMNEFKENGYIDICKEIKDKITLKNEIVQHQI